MAATEVVAELQPMPRPSGRGQPPCKKRVIYLPLSCPRRINCMTAVASMGARSRPGKPQS